MARKYGFSVVLAGLLAGFIGILTESEIPIWISLILVLAGLLPYVITPKLPRLTVKQASLPQPSALLCRRQHPTRADNHDRRRGNPTY